MKRMKKKVVAMVTLAMFVMTLLPMAAFADVTNVDLDNSEFKTVEENVSADVNEVVPVELNVRDAAGKPTVENNGVVYAWLEDANGDVVYDVQFYSDANGTNKIANPAVLDGGYAFRAGSDGSAFKSVKISKAGTYTLKAGFLLGTQSSTTNDRSDLRKLAPVSNHDTIEVTANDVTQFEFKQDSTTQTITKDSGDVELVSVKDNGRDSKKFTLVAKDKTGAKISGKELSVKSNSSNLVVTGDTTTDNAGKVELTYKAKATGKFTITVKVDELTAKFIVNVEDKEAKTPDVIKTVVDNKVVSLDDAKANNFEDAVQFEVLDQNGDKMDAADAFVGSAWKGEWLNEPLCNGSNVADYSTIVEQPAKSTLKDGDITLQVKEDADANKVFTIKVKDTTKIKEGTYKINLALFNGASANATFEVKEAGDAVALKIDGNDTVKAGEPYTAKLYKVDANGIETQVTEDNMGSYISVGYNAVNGAAVEPNSFKTIKNDNDNKFGFTGKDKEEYYGVKVTLYAIDSDNGLQVTKDVTIVDPSADDKVTYEFDSTKGEINKDNTVKMTLKDEYNNVKEVDSNSVHAYVAKSSDADANVSVNLTGSKLEKGKMTFKVYSDKATTADIVIAATTDKGAVYATTLTYTFGEQDIQADTSVVMTIGSSEMLVNNKVVDMKDAAPFIKDNRTFVPFRALGEALGADVEYVEADKTVTYELGSTKIVMTLGDKKITVNGAEKTMDVAPFAKDGRTYVPVRFVGESLGFKVTGLQDAQGHYVAVAFTK